MDNELMTDVECRRCKTINPPIGYIEKRIFGSNKVDSVPHCRLCGVANPYRVEQA